MLLKKLLRSIQAGSTGNTAVAPEYPLEVEERLHRAHANVPVREHLSILYGDLRIGEDPFVDVYFRCLEHTGTVVTPFNVFQRFQTRHDLVRYLRSTETVAGARVECGAYRGATALLMCHVLRGSYAQFRGEGVYLIDSFTGTSTSKPEDLIPVRASSGSPRLEPFFPPGKSDVSPSMVKAFFQDFPAVRVLSGWVPQVFDGLGEERFAFVHVDLTLFEATHAALEYFYPRMNSGGVLLCDGSLFCPGVEKAVERYSREHNVPYVTLGHRQFVLRKA